jgi:hypothetical protein
VNIRIEAEAGSIVATFACNGDSVSASGVTLTDAVKNLALRFKQLQEAALEEMLRHGFISVVDADAGELS